MYPARPWTAQYEPGVPISLPPADGTLQAALESAAATSPGQPALRFFGASMSFAQLDALAERVAAALRRQGLEPGQRVLIALPQSPNLVAACLGVLKAGCVAAPISPGSTKAEIERAALAVEPRVAIASPRVSRELLRVLPFGESTIVSSRASRSLPLLVRAIALVSRAEGESNGRSLDGAADWDEWLKGSSSAVEAEISASDPALLALGSERSEPLEYTHSSLVAGAAQIRAWLTDAMPGHDTWLQLAPLWTELGFVAVLGTAVAARAQTVLLPSWQVVDVLDVLRYLRPAYIMAGRVATERIVAEPRLARVGLGGVRAWLTHEPMPQASARAFEEMAGLPVCQGYGPEGVVGLALCNPVNGRREAGSLGVPLPGIDVQILGPTGKPVSQGQIGELALSGPNVAPAVAAGEWYKTGLPARLDDTGFVFPAEA